MLRFYFFLEFKGNNLCNNSSTGKAGEGREGVNLKESVIGEGRG